MPGLQYFIYVWQWLLGFTCLLGSQNQHPLIKAPFVSKEVKQRRDSIEDRACIFSTADTAQTKTFQPAFDTVQTASSLVHFPSYK